MIESHPSNSYPVYLKQQTCLKFHCSTPPLLQWTKEISFEKTAESPSFLPSILEDSLAEAPILYLLQWREENSKIQLYLSEHQETGNWKMIEMNNYPKKVFITDGRIFLFGASQLFMVSIHPKDETECIPLEEVELVDAKLSFSQLYEPGIYVVFFSTKLGYFSKHFSRSSHRSLWERVKSICKNPFATYKPYEHFKIILPNILAVVLNQNQLFLYDLHLMAVTSLGFHLLEVKQRSKIVLKWKLAPVFQLYTDGIEMFIARENHIEVLRAKIIRKEFKVERHLKVVQDRVALDQLIGGDIVNWTESTLEKQMETLWAEGQIEDIELVNNNLVYRCLKDNQRHIPVISIISLPDQSRTNGIVSQQMQIWKEYLTGSGSIDSYSIRQNSQGEEIGKKKIENHQLMNVSCWNKNNAYLRFIVFESKLYIARKGSLTLFKEIDEFQYALDLYTETMMTQDESEIRTETIYDLNLNLRRMQQSLDLVPLDSKLNYYKKIMTEVKKWIQYQGLIKDEENSVESSIQNKTTLLMSVVKDSINHFGMYMHFSMQSLKIEEKSSKNMLIVRIMNFLRLTYQDNELKQVLGESLVSKFINFLQKQLKLEEFTVNSVFNRIFSDILPDCFISHRPASLSYNYFLDFIIETMIMDSKDEQLLASLQLQLKKFISIFTTTLDKGILTQLFIKNSSLFQAYMISHPAEEELKSTLNIILKQSQSNLLILDLRKIKDLIANQLQCLLSVKMEEEDKNIFGRMAEVLKKTCLNGATHQQKEMRSAITQQILLFDSDETFLRSCTQIISTFSSMSVLFFAEFDEKLQKIQSIYNKQLSLDILNQNYKHILQLQGTMLSKYTKIFNESIINLQETSSISKFHSFLKALLDKIEISYENYVRYYRLYFNIAAAGRNTKESVFKQISTSVDQEERISAHSLPIRLSKFVCSKMAIILWKLLFSDLKTFSKAVNCKIFSTSSNQSLISLVVGLFVEKDRILGQDIDILYYLLMKNGQKMLKDAFRQCDSEKIVSFVTQLKRKRGHGVLIDLTAEQLEQSDMPPKRYVNPFVV